MITFIQRHLVKATPFLAILTQFCKNSRSSFWTTIIAPSYREIKRYKLDDDRQETEGLVLPLVLEKWCWTSILGDTSMQWLFYILLLCLPNIQVTPSKRCLCLEGSPTEEQAAACAWPSVPSFLSPNLQNSPPFLVSSLPMNQLPATTGEDPQPPLFSSPLCPHFPQLFFFIA